MQMPDNIEEKKKIKKKSATQSVFQLTDTFLKVYFIIFN